MSFEVRLEQFNGPLHKLLELIEEKKLEVTQVSLAAVTADFIGYVEKLEKACPPDFEQTKSGLAGRSGKVGRGVDASILADFIVVAARLLLIKSKVLLPDLTLTQEEQIDIADLENRLKVYQQFSARGGQGRNDCDDREEAGAGVTASQYIQQLWQKNEVGFSRPLFASLGDPSMGSGRVVSFFYPPKGVDAARLNKSLTALFTILQGLLPESKKIHLKTVTLQEKIAELTKRLSEAVSFNLKGITGKRNRQEVVVLFLAVLHMLANRLAQVEQGETFGDIVVKKFEARSTKSETGSTSSLQANPNI